MFIGHFAPALAAASHPKAPSLPVLLVGAQLVDWGFFSLVILGVEKMRITPGFTVMNPLDLYHMPWTHSLFGAAVWAAGFALMLRVWLKSWTPALIGGSVVLSHWFLDLLVHAPDLTLAGSPPKLGMGLWNHPAIEMPLEIGITLLGLSLYARATGGWRMPVLVLGGLLLALQAFNWFGPAPTAVDASLTWLALLAFGLVAAIGWWAARDETRKNL
jgi:hypothetical protein